MLFFVCLSDFWVYRHLVHYDSVLIQLIILLALAEDYKELFSLNFLPVCRNGLKLNKAVLNCMGTSRITQNMSAAKERVLILT